jgi:uncharacterized SAM-binding protein YcdF (DUF218 family)
MTPLQRRWKPSRPRTFQLLAAGTTAAALMAMAIWNAGLALVVTSSLSRTDAVVSLASHEWERLPMTARLAAENPGALVLLTLPQPSTPFNCHDCANRVDRLRHLGVDPSRIRIVPLTAGGTYGEALAVFTFARQTPMRRLVVVTSPYHTRRALATFRDRFAGTGIEVGVQPASATSPADPARWWRRPYDRWYVRYEWLALAYYAVRFGVDPLPNSDRVSQEPGRS